MTYRIKDWQKHFEVAQSRRSPRTLKWVAIPNRHDGKGFRRIAEHEHSIEIFAAWVLIVQVASRMSERGTLADDDGPLDAEDLYFKTGFPKAIFKLAFEVLTQPRIGWLETVEDMCSSDRDPTALGVQSETPQKML